MEIKMDTKGCATDGLLVEVRHGKYRYNSNRAHGIHGSRAVGELEIRQLQGVG